MDLENAIRVLIAQEGINILSNTLLVNYLSDLQAFEEMPPAKYIIKMMCSEGTMSQIKAAHKNNCDFKEILKKTSMEMISKWGFQKDAVNSTLVSIAKGIGVKNSEALNDNYTNDILANKNGNDSAQHFSFKGIKICGSLDSVISQFSTIGFSLADRSDNGAILIGPFAGLQECEILIVASPIISEVYSISALLPTQKTWWGLKVDYNNFKDKLIKKYGKPKDCYEYFTTPYEEGDGYEITALANEHATYLSVFETENGEIELFITDDRVHIAYRDSTNYKLIEERKNSLADLDL